MGKRYQDVQTGKFLPKMPEEKMIQKNMSLDPKQLEELKTLLQPKQTVSDLVREAIALYIHLHKK